MSDEIVYLVFVPDHKDSAYSLIWADGDSLYEEYAGYDGKINQTDITYMVLETDLIVNNVIPNHSYVPWLSCAECGACSWNDFLCPECRDG